MELSKIDTKAKREFLAKLQSGKFTLAPGNRQKGEAKTFNRTDTGHYQCDQTGEILTIDEVESISGQYDFCVTLVDTPQQVAGLAPPEGFYLVNVRYGEDKFLDGLLVAK